MKNYLDTSNQNIAWFRKQYDLGQLEMSPPFQRNPVWTINQKSFLIDSVLLGYPIPEIYIQEKITDSGDSKYIIVDGQQRIRSILEFIRGDFAIAEGESQKWASFSFDDLSSDDKKNFFAYKFVVRNLPDTTDSEIRSIFQRINKNNIALNAQELRQSTYSGEFIKLMNKLADKSYWKDLGLFSAEKVRRMIDVEFISELAIAYLNGPQNKKDKLDYYYTLYETEFNDSEDLEKLFDNVCNEIISLLQDRQKTRWVKLIDFYTLFLVLADREGDLPFSKDDRVAISNKLVEFSNTINLYQKNMEYRATVDSNSSLAKYCNGIRNSSDLKSRKDRFDALNEQLFK